MIKPLKVVFFLPFVLGITLATFYTVYMIKIEISQVMAPLVLSLLVGILYMGFQLFFYLLYKRLYTRRMITYLGLENE